MIKSRIIEAIKDAMRSRDSERLTTLRTVHSSIKDFEINNRVEATDVDVIHVLKKGIKMRKDAIEKFKEAARNDLVAKEEAEVAIIESFLPEQLSDEQVERIVRETIEEVGASSMKEMGKVVKAALEKAEGRADGSVISRLAKNILGSK